MRGYMFRNRWGALLFVGLTLAGVAQLVGTGKGDGALEQASAQLAERKAKTDALAVTGVATGTPAAAGRPAPVEFMPDDELIDPAQGEDPTPIDQRWAEDAEKNAGEAGGGDAPHDTVILVTDESAPPPAQ